MDTNTNTNISTTEEWLGVIFWMGSMAVYAHGATQQEAAQAVAKLARKAQPRERRREPVTWLVSLYRVGGRPWSYWDDTGFQGEDGQTLRREAIIAVEDRPA